MKIAILSDIHGNITALKAVLEHAETIGVDTYYILGDLIGYYVNPIEVIQLVKDLPNKVVLQGNHERMLFDVYNGLYNISELTRKYGEGHKVAFTGLENIDIDWLKSLPKEAETEQDNIFMKLCHGAPGNEDLYLYPNSNKELLQNACAQKFDFVFVGHSHYPFITYHEGCLLVNVGSVGMAKDIGGMASWGVLNTVSKTYIPLRTPYNKQEVIGSLTDRRNSNKEYLISVLQRNNKEESRELDI